MDDNNRVAGLLVRKVNLEGQEPIPGTVPKNVRGFGGAGTDIRTVMSFLQIEIFPSDSRRPTEQARALIPGMSIYRHPELDEEHTIRRALVEAVKEELREFPLGRRFVRFIEDHEPEVARLVNHRRRVTVAWHRAHGPAFLALLLRGLRGVDQPIPRVVNGIPIEESLASVKDAVEREGSADLAEEVRHLWPPLREAVPRSKTVGELISNLRSVPYHE
jgi:hypothetical protein